MGHYCMYAVMIRINEYSVLFESLSKLVRLLFIVDSRHFWILITALDRA